MAAVPKYVIIIEDSNGKTYEFEKATQKAWEWYENNVGRCRFFVPYNDLKLSATSLSDSAFSEIRIYRDNLLVWQGMVMYLQDTKDGTLVYGETFLRALGWYGVRYDQAYTDAAIGTLISAEYDQIVAKADDFLAAKITKGTIQEPYTNGTTDSLTISKTLYNDNFLDLLKALTAVARGEMDSGVSTAWNQHAVFEITFSDTTPTFNFWRDKGTDQNDVQFTLGSEIIDFTLPKDFRGIYNYTKAFAIEEGPKVLTSEQNDATSRGLWYRREAYPYYGQLQNQDELNQRAKDFNKERKDPGREIILRFASGLKPFDGYSMGDSVKLVINRGRTQISELRRVIGMYVDITDEGIEQTTPILEKPRS